MVTYFLKIVFFYRKSLLCLVTSMFNYFKYAQDSIFLQDVPITVDIGSEFRIGTRLFIAGRLKLLPHS